jgi:hypothetical protein
MNQSSRRKFLGLSVGAAASTVVIGVTARPAEAFLPLWLRLLLMGAKASKQDNFVPIPQKKTAPTKRRRRRQVATK